MTINNTPASVRKYIVFRTLEDGSNWYWGSWDEESPAWEAAVEIGGDVILADYVR